MEIHFLPGGEWVVGFFFLFILIAVASAISAVFFSVGHWVKTQLFRHTPAGKKLSAGFSSERRGFDKWPWYLTNKLSVALAVVGFCLVVYAGMGPILSIVGMMGG